MPAAHGGWMDSGGRRPKASRGGNRGGERYGGGAGFDYRDLTVVAVIRHHNFCVMAQKLRLVKSDFCILCNFNELRVVKIPHISTSALYTDHIG